MKETYVTIVIRTLQRRADGTELVTQRAEGHLRREGGLWRLTYREGPETGLGNTRTTLSLAGGRAELKREGETASHLIFQKDVAHASVYETPYGKLPMTVRALGVEWDLTEVGGTVFIAYKIQLDGAEIGENRLRITVREKEKTV